MPKRKIGCEKDDSEATRRSFANLLRSLPDEAFREDLDILPNSTVWEELQSLDPERAKDLGADNIPFLLREVHCPRSEMSNTSDVALALLCGIHQKELAGNNVEICKFFIDDQVQRAAQQSFVHKELGNIEYKKDNFQKAAVEYSKGVEILEDALERMSDIDTLASDMMQLWASEILAVLLNNRAMAFLKLSKYDKVIRDAGYALRCVRSPNPSDGEKYCYRCGARDVVICKALWRRAQALEKMGNHSAALSDLDFISRSRSERWMSRAQKWIMEMQVRPDDWGNLDPEILKTLKDYLITSVDAERHEAEKIFRPRTQQCSVQVGEFLYILGGTGTSPQTQQEFGLDRAEIAQTNPDYIGDGDMSKMTPEHRESMMQLLVSSRVGAHREEGLCKGSEFLQLHLPTMTWKKLPWPQRLGWRKGSTVVHFQNSLWLVGGHPELWVNDNVDLGLAEFHIPTKKWRFPKTKNKPKFNIWEHKASVCNGKMYVFGGENKLSHTDQSCSLWCLDFSTMRWKKLSPTKRDKKKLKQVLADCDMIVGAHLKKAKGSSSSSLAKRMKCKSPLKILRPYPEARANHGFWSNEKKNCLYVFGGCYKAAEKNSSYGLSTLGDLWKFDIDSETWSSLPLLGNFPGPRAEFGMCETPTGAMLFGGFNHSLAQWVSNASASGFLMGSYFNDTYIFDNKTETWKLVTCKTHDCISKKMFASLAVHDEQFYVVGGCNNLALFSDVHILDLMPLRKSKRKKIARCAVCNRSKLEVQLLQCNGCQRTWYCSKEHQKKDWKSHKAKCKKWRKQRETRV